MIFTVFKTLIFFVIFSQILVAQGYICAIGGGSEDYNDWSDEPYSWIVTKSNFGKVIILSASEATNWIPNYFISFGADTAYNLNINTKSKANQQSTFNDVVSAKAIFIKGGDQWDYVRLWKNTLLDSAITTVFKNGGVISGTSAGAAILGEVDFSAKNGTVYSDEALQNPFNDYMQFETSFLNFADDVIFDSHLTERARQGRLVAFLYNNYFNSNKNLVGIGIDDRTAVGISPNGIAEVFGSGSVMFVHKVDNTKYYQFDSTLTIENLLTDFLTKGWKYNILDRKIEFIPTSAKEITISNEIENIAKRVVLISGNDLTKQTKNNISNELKSLSEKNVLIFSNNGFEEKHNKLISFLDSCGINSNIINISEESLNSLDNLNFVNEASNFIIYGDSLSLLSKLRNTEYSVSNAFQNSISQNKYIMFIGDCGKLISDYYVDYKIDDIYASYYGRMNLKDGLNLVSNFTYQPSIFVNSDLHENNMSSLFLNQKRNKKRYGLFLNGNDKVEIDFQNSTIIGNCKTPYILVDAAYTTYVDSSTYKASSNSGTRQIVAMNNLKISLSNNNSLKYSLTNKNYDLINSVNQNSENITKNIFTLEQNYPNPFNPKTKIKFELVTNSFVQLIVYDILGNKIETIIDDYLSKGKHEIVFENSAKLTSGIYYYTLKTENQSITKSMVLLK
ncbi:MAG: Type 1 glutamine amidotransferase-like domain-containing protein [Melioribacteraceae bacterium]